MDSDEFVRVAEEEYEALPEQFKGRIENLRIVVEDFPGPDLVRQARVRFPYGLLGLYQGVPLNYRNTGYGAYPVVPDTITLFKRNIEAITPPAKLREKIREVLIHEIGHYFGMTEEEIRHAGY